MSDFDLDSFIPYQLAVIAARTSRDFARHYRDQFDISIPEWRVVAHLAQSGKVSVREIHQRVDMDKSKVSRAAARLEAAGYVAKESGQHDRRLVELSLTPRGQALMDSLAPIARAYQDRFVQELGADAAGFGDTLKRLMQQGTGAR